MYQVKIIGAGSIGNHLAHASRRLGWKVTLCDLDAAALARTRTQIYPQRYGHWDDEIVLRNVKDAPREGFDLVAIGTPPDSHVELALDALAGTPRSLLVEKPLCSPALERAEELRKAADARGVRVFVGYNHSVGKACVDALPLLDQIGAVETLDVETREHWGGILAAHPWLSGPADSYLGFWRRGGGASGEHSHALHLWQHLAHAAGAGRVAEVTASMDYVRTRELDYDRVCLLNLVTENGLLGRVVQDVVTSPPRKWARVQGSDGFVEIAIGQPAGADTLGWRLAGGDAGTRTFQKTRPDDFIQELEHVARVVEGREASTPLSLERGLEAMLVIAAAHLSARERRSVRIDHAAGCVPGALQPQ
jgi:predicted dehydrogenase